VSNRRAHNNTGRSIGTRAERIARKLNAPPPNTPWVWVTKVMIESPAHRALSGAARKVIDRITLEHMAHGGGRNGQLEVTYADFRRYGIRGSSIYPAIEEAVALGFIERVDPGQKAWGDFKGSSARYRIEWLPDRDGSPATNRWKRLETLDQAREAAARTKERVRMVRLEETSACPPDPRQVTEGKRILSSPDM
jgi:hypothetical protein